MVSNKSKSNLRRGNPGNRGNQKGRGAAGATWAELIQEYGNTSAPAEFAAPFGGNANWKWVVVAAAYRHAAAGNAAILKELMQRSEPQPFLNLDLSKLNVDQLERIAAGEDPAVVLATPGESRVAETPEANDDRNGGAG